MYFKLGEYPPGLDRRGTEYQALGRFYDADLVRWHLKRAKPIGGWSQIVTALTGTARAIHSWVDNSAAGRAALGTESNLYVLTTAGVLTDITPVSGWSSQAATSTWSLDNAGQLLVGVNDAHGTIFTWSPGDAAAAVLTNAPTADAVVVTNEGIIMALGAAGNPRAISWCDRDDFTDWTAGFADLAGDLNIQAKAGIMFAKNIRAGTLIFTGEDLQIARYVGLPNVYGVTRVADSCGAISRGAGALVDDMAYWMGVDKFHVCNGGAYVDDLPCMIYDDVHDSLNRDHADKVRAMHNTEFNEIWWFYPKGSATENSHVAVYNYLDKHWTHHAIDRLCGTQRGNGFSNPLMIDGSVSYEHETGTTMTGAGTPFLQTGPHELGNGEQVMGVDRCIPDEAVSGQISLSFKVRDFPNGTERTEGPFTASEQMPMRWRGRQASLVFTQATAADWKVGNYRLSGKAMGLR